MRIDQGTEVGLITAGEARQIEDSMGNKNIIKDSAVKEKKAKLTDI